MPTIKRIGPYRFFFVSLDNAESPHIHIQREQYVAKFWLNPVALAKTGGFKAHELNRIARWFSRIRMNFWRSGMNSLATIDMQPARAQAVRLTDDMLIVELVDGREIRVPLAWYPRLWYGTPEERAHVELLGDGEILHWPELDEDLSVQGLLLGRKSGESQQSLQRWLASRRQM